MSFISLILESNRIILDRADKHIIIKITNKGVFYNEDEFIEWKHTNFPPKKEFNFNQRRDIFWEVKMISYDRGNAQLNVEVVNYDVESREGVFISQKAKFSFQRIGFSKLKWSELRRVLNIYTQILFNEISDSGEQIKEVVREKIRDENWFDFSEQMVKPEQRSIHFKYPLKKARFKMGYVELEKKLDGLSRKIKINIENSNLIPEFDHVKSFFAKALGKREIEVTGYYKIDEKGEMIVKCQSKEINQIDEDLVKTVRLLKLRESIFKPKIRAIDKSLFTPEEYFESLEEERLGNTIRNSDKDLLEEILQLKGIRNRKQLIYLSGKLQSTKAGLRFTLSPQFGFLFYVEGEEMDHYIWELLNTNATYIWSLDKECASLEGKFKLVESNINFIRENGRRVYLNSEKYENMVFNKINHEKSEKGIVDGFPKWKMRVNEKIV